ncbi:MAG: phosphatase PAP2 family protein [Succinivibrio sp.]|nr:phosphatase PAP2 family protein [Succinivibrio sp.]
MKYSKFTVNMLTVICASSLATACVSNSDQVRSHQTRAENSEAVNSEANLGYLKGYDADIIDVELVLPEPATVTDAVYFNDWYQYYKNKPLRDTQRGDLARTEASLSVDSLMNFSKAFGIQLSPENTPDIWHMLQRACYNLFDANSKIKNRYKRIRPYVQYNDSTGYAPEEAKSRKSFSYPSTHAVLGFGIALLLSEVNPDRQNEILKRGYELGQSRVILGYHYQSDVRAARLVAAMVTASMHSDSEFLRDMEKAKAELRQKSEYK